MAQGTNALASQVCQGEEQVKLGEAAPKGSPEQHRRLELIFRELAAVAPDDLSVLFRLARVQEDQQQLDAAETTLLYAHHLRPAEAEPNRMLARFYSRRVAELSLETSRQISAQQAPAAQDQPDKDGFYRLGGAITPPRRLDNPKYPKEAQDAGIEGLVMVEISLTVPSR